MTRTLEDQLWEYAWQQIEQMDWDQLTDLAGPELTWVDDDFELLQSAAAEALFEQLKKVNSYAVD